MHSRFGRALVVAILLSSPVAEARSQVVYGYYPGYGPYGWGGWGGTVQGSIARGLGYFALGAGAYNRQTAVANAINANTIMRWNQYMFLAQQEANRRAYLRRERMQGRDIRAGEEIVQRILKNPTEDDIEDGDALNAILDQVTDPGVHSSALRLATEPVDGEAVRAIPFFNAPQAATINLDRLTAEDGWPAALRGPSFAPWREAYRKAVQAALSEAVDQERPVSPATLRDMRAALARLRAGLDASAPKDPVESANARNYLKALAGMTRMLDRPGVEKVVAELETVGKTTLGSLLGFMQAYNLRFGRATTARQRAVYRELYPKVAALRDRLLGEAGKRGPSDVASGTTGGPTDFFGGMELEDLEKGPDDAGSAR